jgi:hypothetical protein
MLDKFKNIVFPESKSEKLGKSFKKLYQMINPVNTSLQKVVQLQETLINFDQNSEDLNTINIINNHLNQLLKRINQLLNTEVKVDFNKTIRGKLTSSKNTYNLKELVYFDSNTNGQTFLVKNISITQPEIDKILTDLENLNMFI